MAKTISITIDLTKIDRTRIQERKYTNKEGQEVTVKEYKLDVVEKPDASKKLIKDGGSWQMWKTHFVKDTQTKEERAQKLESKILGDGITFTYPEDNFAQVNARKEQFAKEVKEQVANAEPAYDYPTPNDQDIPFN